MIPTVNIENFNRAISDVYYTTQGGLFRADYLYLLEELYVLRKENDILIPRPYQTNMLEPFIKFLENLDKDNFNKLFQEDGLTANEFTQKKIIIEVSEALLQRNHKDKYYSASFEALQALQAVIAALYDSFLHSQYGYLFLQTLAPLAKWGNSTRGPYTCTSQLASKIGVTVGIVSFPPEFRTGGLLSWAALGHEVAGHNLLQAHSDLLPQLKAELGNNLRQMLSEDEWGADLKAKIIDYWVSCTEEMACDLLGEV